LTPTVVVAVDVCVRMTVSWKKVIVVVVV